MINMPLPLKIQLDLDTATEIKENKATVSNNLMEDCKIDYIASDLSIVYPMLTLAEALEVETALLSTNGTERILYNGIKYLIKDGYTVTINNSYAKIELLLATASGGLI